MPKQSQPIELLGSISPEQFLAEFWQKKPLLIRQAIPGFESPIDPDELAGLATEDEVESRIILEHGKEHPWELRRGPFSEEDFATLPETNWTLLIQQLDAWSPEINDLKRLFQFIPNWRIDDVMASYAPKGGSVGPHFDYYDVFLLQAYGQRHWRLGQMCSEKSPSLEDTPLSILQDFDEHQDWILHPGDMLYLPPKLAHYGVALNDCITLSIGFRAPTHDQILSHFTDHLIEQMPSNRFYEDPGLKLQAHCGEISSASLAAVKTILQQYLDNEPMLKRWFGKYSTEAKNEHLLSIPETPYNKEDLHDASVNNMTVFTNEGSRFAYTLDNDNLYFFADGRDYVLEPSNLKFVQTLCEMGSTPAKQLIEYTESTQLLTLTLDLLNQGSLYFSEDDE